MKIGIIGDTHFGAGFNLGKIDTKTQLNTRLIDFSKTFNRIIDEFIEQDVELVVLTGDIFETRHPTSAQLNAFSLCLSRAVKKGLKIVVVVGNHDQQRTISTTTVDIFKSLNIDNVSVYADMGVYTITSPKDGSGAHLFLMPYRDKRMLEASTNSEAIEKIRVELQELKSRVDNKLPHIIVGHYMMDKENDEFTSDAFSINELALPLDMFSNFDATVMGHVHQHEIVSKSPPIIYSGSMEKVSFGEKFHNKVSLILDTRNINNINVIPNKVRPLYEINLDYTDEKLYKIEINDKIIQDIDEYCDKHNVKGSIVKLIAKVKHNDLYYINQARIKSHIVNKNIKYLSSIQISSVNNRQLRNKNITEGLAGKEAMESFIDGLVEPDSIKKKLHKCAKDIMTEVGGFQ